MGRISYHHNSTKMLTLLRLSSSSLLLVMMLFCHHHHGVQSFHITHPQQQHPHQQRHQIVDMHRSSLSVPVERISCHHSKSRVVLNEQRDSSEKRVTNSNNDSINKNNNMIGRYLRKTTISVLLCLSIVSGGIITTGNGNNNMVDSSMIANAASDPSKIVGCLFEKCSVPLGKCIASPLCLANVVCINTCNNRPDEIECQIKCGDIFDNPVIAEFNKCAVSDMSCVPQQSDDGRYPVPSNDITVPKFNTNFFNGRLYITAGTKNKIMLSFLFMFLTSFLFLLLFA